MPGSAQLARTADARSPDHRSTGSKRSRSVAMQANGMGSASNVRHGRTLSMKRPSRSLLMSPARLITGRARADQRIVCTQPVIRVALMPAAASDPTSAPALVPTIRSGRIPASSSTLRTPTCAMPRAAPPPRTSPSRGRSAVRATSTPPVLIADLGSLARPRTAARAASP